MPVYISVAVKQRNEVLPLGNLDVPGRTTAGGFRWIHCWKLSFRISRIALQFKLVSRFAFRLRRRAIQVQLALGTVAVATQ